MPSSSVAPLSKEPGAWYKTEFGGGVGEAAPVARLRRRPPWAWAWVSSSPLVCESVKCVLGRGDGIGGVYDVTESGERKKEEVRGEGGGVLGLYSVNVMLVRSQR